MRAFLWGIFLVAAMAGNASLVLASDESDTRTATAISPVKASFTPAHYIPPGNRLDPQAALEKINALRQAHGAAPLTLDPALNQAAVIHAEDLASRDAISHYGRDGSTPVTRVAATGYDAVLTGENVATGQRRFDDVLDGWFHSDSHRTTLLLPDAVHVGLALVYNPDSSSRTFWTMVVAEPF